MKTFTDECRYPISIDETTATQRISRSKRSRRWDKFLSARSRTLVSAAQAFREFSKLPAVTRPFGEAVPNVCPAS